jgi:hypothetical protein
MIKPIEKVWEELKKKHKFKKNVYLASGGLVDVKGIGTSDVDIVYLTKTKEEYMSLDKEFPGSKKEVREDKNRCYYHFKHGGRDVAVCASNDPNVLRSVTHRKNEIMLNKFPHIVSAAIVYKLNGAKTEPAYCKALGLELKEDAEAYDLMMMPAAKLKKIAATRESNLKRIFDSRAN